MQNMLNLKELVMLYPFDFFYISRNYLFNVKNQSPHSFHVK